MADVSFTPIEEQIKLLDMVEASIPEEHRPETKKAASRHRNLFRLCISGIALMVMASFTSTSNFLYSQWESPPLQQSDYPALTDGDLVSEFDQAKVHGFIMKNETEREIIYFTPIYAREAVKHHIRVSVGANMSPSLDSRTSQIHEILFERQQSIYFLPYLKDDNLYSSTDESPVFSLLKTHNVTVWDAFEAPNSRNIFPDENGIMVLAQSYQSKKQPSERKELWRLMNYLGPARYSNDAHKEFNIYQYVAEGLIRMDGAEFGPNYSSSQLTRIEWKCCQFNTVASKITVEIISGNSPTR